MSANKWLLLDADIAGREYTLLQIAKSLNNKDIRPDILPLFDNGKLITNSEMASTLSKEKPDVIVFQGAYGWKYAKELEETGAKIHNLLFDDPVMRMEGLGVVNQVQAYHYRSNFKLWIWDGYWSEVMLTKYQVICNDMHLAAHPDEFYPSDTSLGNEVMFIGNLNNPIVIEEKISMLPSIFNYVARLVQDEIKHSSEWPLKSWDKWIDNTSKNLPQGGEKLFDQLSSAKPEYLFQLRHIVWNLLKNEARIRMLKKALEVCPITIACETVQQDHANQDQIRGMLNTWSCRLNVVNTSKLKQKEFSHIYHYGNIHINATDPQSVESGIPYRVFQTAASGKALITDTRPGLSKCFTPKEHYMPYENLDEFQATLSAAINNISKVKEIGMAARERFVADHTWDKRVDQMSEKGAIGSPSLITMDQLQSGLFIDGPFGSIQENPL